MEIRRKPINKNIFQALTQMVPNLEMSYQMTIIINTSKLKDNSSEQKQRHNTMLIKHSFSLSKSADVVH